MKIISYKNNIIFLVIFIFYSSIGSYSAVLKYGVINPKNLLLMSIVLITYLNFTSFYKFHFFKIPIMKWIILYVSIVFLWFILPNNYMTYEEFRIFIFSIIFFVSMTILISNDDDNFSKTRGAILFVTLLAISNNIYEFFNPFAFYDMNSEYNIIGRSAGFYIDPNISAQAILYGLIFSYTLIPKNIKILFLLFTLLGVLVTFSRGGIIGWLIIVTLLFKYKQIDKKTIVTILLILFISIIILLPILTDIIMGSFDGQSDNLLNRLNFFNTSSKMDASQIERLAILNSAFNLFADNPFFGAGLSIIRHWGYSVAPHNMYLMLMAQFGFVGLVLYIYLMYVIVQNAKDETKIISKIFLFYILFTSLLTHNILDGYHNIIAIVLMSNMSYRSYTIYKNKEKKQ
jgi:O-antigen ligase